jgi:hypothetical protein
MAKIAQDRYEVGFPLLPLSHQRITDFREQFNATTCTSQGTGEQKYIATGHAWFFYDTPVGPDKGSKHYKCE